MIPAGRDTVVARGWLADADALRAVAFVWIVLGHAIAVMAGVPHTTPEMGVFGVLLAMTRFALPAFMMISSLLIARRMADSEAPGTGKALGRLLLPYLLWTTFYLLLGLVSKGGTATGSIPLARAWVIALLTGSGYYHLWYVVIAVQIVVVAPFVARWLVPLSVRGRLGVLALTVLANIALLGQVWGPVTDRLSATKLIFGSPADRIVLFWAAYVVLGVVVGLDHQAWRDALRRFRPWILAAWGAVVVRVAILVWRQAFAVGGDYRATTDISRVMQPWILPVEMLSIIAWLEIADVLAGTRLAPILSRISRGSFGGYLVHPLFITFGAEFIYSSWAEPNASVSVLAVTAFALVASVAFTSFLGRASVPLGQALVGIRTPSRSTGE